jgi:predicted phosphodiesterase
MEVIDTVPQSGEWPHHRHLDRQAWEELYVVGDVHGCLASLEALLERLSITPDDLVVFVGDLVRKGPDSQAVVDLVRDNANCTSVRGNNEQKLLSGSTACGLSESALAYLDTLPSILTVGDDLAIVHGGLRPDRGLAAQDAEEVLTLRSLDGSGYDGPFWFDEYDGPPTVCFGHTVLADPLETEWAIGLDTGCVYGGELTAYDARRETFVSVSGTEHQARSADSILSPGERSVCR